jgi:hypothetical protein
MINQIYYSKFGFDHALTEKPKEPIYSVSESRNVPTGDRVPCFTTLVEKGPLIPVCNGL